MELNRYRIDLTYNGNDVPDILANNVVLEFDLRSDSLFDTMVPGGGERASKRNNR